MAPDLSDGEREKIQILTDVLNRSPLPGDGQAHRFSSRIRELFPPFDRPLRAIDVHGPDGEAAKVLLPLSGAPLQEFPSNSPLGERATLMAGREKQRQAERKGAENLLIVARDPSLGVSERALRELDSIFQENDPVFLRRSLWIWVRGNFLEGSFRPEAALKLLNTTPELFQEEDGARDFLAMVKGGGSWGRNLEFQLKGISSEAIRPAPILMMAGVGLLGPMAKFAVTGHLARFGALGRGLSSAVGLGTEALVFTAWSRALSEQQGQTPPHFGSAFLANVMWLGGIRLAHGVTNLPMVRGLPLPQTGREIAAHGLSILAMNQANHLAHYLKLTQDSEFPWGGGWTAETIQYLHTMTGFNLVNRMTGNIFPRAGRYLEQQVENAQVERARQRWLHARGLTPNPELPALPGPQAQVELKFFTAQHSDLVLTPWNHPQKPTWQMIPAGRAYHLDPHLFGKNTEWLQIKRDPSGYFQLWDGRTLRSQPAQIMHHAVLGMDFLKDMPLAHNGRELPTRQWVSLRSGDVLSFLGQRIGLQFPGLDSLVPEIARLPLHLQQFLAQQMRQAKSQKEFFSTWAQAPWPNVAPLWERIQQVWRGEVPLVTLPHELGIQNQVGYWMSRQVEEWKRDGFDPRSFRLAPEAGDPRQLPQETEFHSGRLWGKLREAVASAKTLSDLRYAITASGFESIEGKDMPELARQIGGLEHSNLREVQNLPYAAGIRQRARDLLERESFARFFGKDDVQTLAWIQDRSLARDLHVLQQLKLEIRRQVSQQGAVRSGERVYPVEEIHDLLYDVLDRGKPLALLTENLGVRDLARRYQSQAVALAEKLFAREMQVGMDPFSGEKISSHTPESRFRLALHLLNSHAGWPVRGLPRGGEIQKLAYVVRNFLDASASEYYPDLQEILRRHIDRISPEAVTLLRRATPEDKALILDTYFGNYRRRDLSGETAFQVGVLMAQAGLYREVGMTYEIRGNQWLSTLGLGDLGFFSSEKGGDFYLMHSHPEEYLNDGGQIMGEVRGGQRYDEGGARTMMLGLGENINADTRNIVFSRGDIRAFAPQAKYYWDLGYPQKFGDTPLYEAKNRIYKNFVFHPYGASELRFHLSTNGRLEKVVVRYAFQGDKIFKDIGYLGSIDKLKGMQQELGVPFEFEKIPAKTFVENLPFRIFSFLHY